MRFLENSVVIFFGLAFKGLLTLAVDRQLAVSLGPDLYGEFKYILTIVIILSVFSGLGLSSSIVRYISTNISKHKFVVRVTKQAVFLVSVVCIFSVAVFLIPGVRNWVGIVNHNLFFLIVGTVFFISINSLCQGVFSGLKIALPKSIINDLFGPFLLFFVVYIHFSLQLSLHSLAILYLGYMATVCALNVSYLSTYAKRELHGDSDVDVDLSGEIYQYTWPIYLTSIVIMITASTDKIILARVVSKHDLGIYFTAVTITSIVALVLTALLFLYLPIASKYFGQNRFTLMSYVSAYTSKWAMLIAFIPFWILFLHTEDVIKVVFNQQYLSAIVAVKILSLAQFLNVAVGFTGQNLLAIGDSRIQMKIRLFGLAFGVFAGVYLAKVFGIEGAAFSVFLTLVLTNGCQIIVLHRKYNFSVFKRTNLTAFFLLLLFSVFNTLFHWRFQIEGLSMKVALDLIFLSFWVLTFRLVNLKDYQMLGILNQS